MRCHLSSRFQANLLPSVQPPSAGEIMAQPARRGHPGPYVAADHRHIGAPRKSGFQFHQTAIRSTLGSTEPIDRSLGML